MIPHEMDLPRRSVMISSRNRNPITHATDEFARAADEVSQHQYEGAAGYRATPRDEKRVRNYGDAASILNQQIDPPRRRELDDPISHEVKPEEPRRREVAEPLLNTARAILKSPL